MHQPAAVQWIVNRSRWMARVLLLIWLLGWVSVLTVIQTQVVSLESAVVWGFAMLLISGLAWNIWRGAPTGLLRWDGRAWYWSGFAGDVPCTVTLHMDFQRLLIVSARQTGAPAAWLWLEAFPDTQGWMPLRRALVMAAVNTSAEGVADVSVSEQEQR